MTRKKRTTLKRARKSLRHESLPPELRDFAAGQETTETIANRYGISPATLTVRAKKARLPLRGRGRWRYTEPTTAQKQILALAQSHTYQEVGLRFGVTKQRVSQLVRRWKDWPSDPSTNRSPTPLQRSHIITFRINSGTYTQLKTTIEHPWFKSLGSPNQAAREIVTNFLSTISRGTRSRS